MKDDGLFKKIIQKIKTDKKLEIGIYVGLGLLAVLLYVGSLSASKKPENTSASVSEVSIKDEDVEEKLSSVLSKIRGAGRVQVMITYDTSTQIVPAMNSDTQTGETQGSDSKSQDRSESLTPATITRNGEEEPIVIKEIEPTVRGVIVIAEGAADISVQMKLQHAVETVLGVSQDRIEVFEMDGTNIND